MQNIEDTREASPPESGPEIGDAFGAALLQCWESGLPGCEVFELIERDDGFLNGMDAARYFLLPEAWDPLDQWVCQRAHGRSVDVGSGAGRIALHLQERGVDVTALDVSALCGEVCRRRGVRRVFTGSVFDLARERPEQAPFDAFLLMGNNLGLLGGAEQAPRFLAALANVAAPGAVILGGGMDPYATSNPVHTEYHARNRAKGRMGGQIRMRVRHRRLATEWFDYLFATPDELRGLLDGTGWGLEELEPQKDGNGYAVQLRLAGA